MSTGRVWMDGINGPAMDKFMEDLRSGKYAQTKHQLFTSRGFCCLGVATDGASEACGLVKVNEYRNTHYLDYAGRKFGGLLPRVVAEYLGLPESNLDDQNPGSNTATNVYLKAVEEDERELSTPYESDKAGYRVIAASSMNDSLGKSFADIADRFEDTFKVEV